MKEREREGERVSQWRRAEHARVLVFCNTLRSKRSSQPFPLGDGEKGTRQRKYVIMISLLTLYFALCKDWCSVWAYGKCKSASCIFFLKPWMEATFQYSFFPCFSFVRIVMVGLLFAPSLVFAFAWFMFDTFTQGWIGVASQSCHISNLICVLQFNLI